jgi:hypothetical protein
MDRKFPVFSIPDDLFLFYSMNVDKQFPGETERQFSPVVIERLSPVHPTE